MKAVIQRRYLPPFFEYEVDKEKINKEKLSEKENFQFVQQRNLFDFMRRLMVKRFESSFGSFEQSIKRFKKITAKPYPLLKNEQQIYS